MFNDGQQKLMEQKLGLRDEVGGSQPTFAAYTFHATSMPS